MYFFIYIIFQIVLNEIENKNVNRFQNQLDTYTALNAESTVSGENVLHLKIKGLILDTIHHISVVDELINLRVSSIHDWEWQKRIRFESNVL